MTKTWLAFVGFLGPAAPLYAYSEVYLTDHQALKVLFPEHTFEKKDLELKPEEIEKIQKESGEGVRAKTLNLWKAKNGSVVFIDQVLGKHEFITYAVGLEKSGEVRGIEILEYRESYGHQIRRDSWRKQFVGKNKNSALKLDEDIKNISGATLSSAHITTGVKRILQTYAQIQNRI